jgi:hypothetical protein
MTDLAHTPDNAVECTRPNSTTTKFRCPTLARPAWATEHDDAGTRDSDGAQIIGRESPGHSITYTDAHGNVADDAAVHLRSTLILGHDGIEVTDPVIVVMGPTGEVHYSPAQARALAAALTHHADLHDGRTTA